MSERAEDRPAGMIGFLTLLGVSILFTAAAASPGLREPVLHALTAPARLAAFLLPGSDFYGDASAAGRMLGWLGWALTPLFAIPPLYIVFSAANARAVESVLADLMMFLARMIDRISSFIGGAVSWAALTLVAIVTVIAIQRYVFGISFTKLQELIVYLHAGLFMLSAAATLRADGHVRVDVIYGGLGPRARAVINFFGAYFLLAPLCLVLIQHSGSYVDLAWRSQQGSTETDGIPLVYLLKTLIPIFAVMMLAQAGASASHAAMVIAGDEAPAPERPHDEML